VHYLFQSNCRLILYSCMFCLATEQKSNQLCLFCKNCFLFVELVQVLLEKEARRLFCPPTYCTTTTLLLLHLLCTTSLCGGVYLLPCRNVKDRRVVNSGDIHDNLNDDNVIRHQEVGVSMSSRRTHFSLKTTTESEFLFNL